MRLGDDGKWRVYRWDYALTWIVIRGADVGSIHSFPTHAEALAYAIEQAEAGL